MKTENLAERFVRQVESRTDGYGAGWLGAVVIQGVQLTQIFLRQILKHLADIEVLLDGRAVESAVKFAGQHLHFLPIG